MPSIKWKPAVTLAFPVRDRKAAADWYTERLGFSLLYDVEEIGWCELRTSVPGVTIGLAERQEVPIGGPVPTFEVEDVQAARAYLEEMEVRFEGENIVHAGVVELATFFDLDGHPLMLAEDLRSQVLPRTLDTEEVRS